jgi:DNA-binding GntR family transcriptional regulator
MKNKKKETVYKILQEQIITQELTYGTRLNEKDIMSEFDIGRTPLRDIFMKLKDECLIETIPQSGTFVKELDLKELRDVLEMRIPLEILAAKTVPLRISKEQLDEIDFIIFKLNKDVNTLSINEVKNCTDRIHNIYYEAVGNKRLSENLIVLHNLSARAWFSSGYKRRATQDTINDWQKKIEMVKKQEIKELQIEVEKHVRGFASLLNLELA